MRTGSLSGVISGLSLYYATRQEPGAEVLTKGRIVGREPHIKDTREGARSGTLILWVEDEGIRIKCVVRQGLLNGDALPLVNEEDRVQDRQSRSALAWEFLCDAPIGTQMIFKGKLQRCRSEPTGRNIYLTNVDLLHSISEFRAMMPINRHVLRHTAVCEELSSQITGDIPNKIRILFALYKLHRRELDVHSRAERQLASPLEEMTARAIMSTGLSFLYEKILFVLRKEVNGDFNGGNGNGNGSKYIKPDFIVNLTIDGRVLLIEPHGYAHLDAATLKKYVDFKSKYGSRYYFVIVTNTSNDVLDETLSNAGYKRDEIADSFICVKYCGRNGEYYPEKEAEMREGERIITAFLRQLLQIPSILRV